jgi:NAD(P)-dependent dehydrogenase (short-subunit alcohol dehydrogenase family)
MPTPTSLLSLVPHIDSCIQAAAFPISNYTYKEVQTAFRTVRTHWPTSDIRVALYNAGLGVWKPFLQITEEEVEKVTETNIKGAFAFAREAITAFQGQSIDNNEGKRGTLLFTGATASLRGNTTTAAFSAAKFALRSLSQSLNKEFGKENIHVCAAPLSPSESGLTFYLDAAHALINQSLTGSACMCPFFWIPLLSIIFLRFIDYLLPHACVGDHRRRFVYSLMIYHKRPNKYSAMR